MREHEEMDKTISRRKHKNEKIKENTTK